MRLTTKRRVFIEEYLICWSATEAARRAGYKKPRSQGSRLLTIVDIREHIKNRLAEKVMTADEVLARMSEMSRADISQFIQKSTGAIDWEMVEKKGYLVQEIIHDKGRQSRIKLYSSQRALELMGKHHRLFTERQLNLNIDVENLTDEQLTRLVDNEDPIVVLASKS